ncbi:Solute carrier family 25 member 43 [Balamuthia mandrillaris]
MEAPNSSRSAPSPRGGVGHEKDETKKKKKERLEKHLEAWVDQLEEQDEQSCGRVATGECKWLPVRPSPPPPPLSAADFTAYVVNKLLSLPLEAVKLQLQLRLVEAKGSRRAAFGGVSVGALARQHGFLSLWRGLLPSLLRYYPFNALQLAVQNTIKAVLQLTPERDRMHEGRFLYLRALLGGWVAGALSLAAVYPLDVSYTRLSMDLSGRHYRGTFSCLWDMYREEGLRALYRGYLLSAFAILPYRFVYFASWDSTQKTVLKGETTVWKKFLLGQIASITAMTATYPLDTIKRVMQVSNMGLVESVLLLWREGGVSAFYAGFVVNLLRHFLSSLYFSLFDELLQKYTFP